MRRIRISRRAIKCIAFSAMTLFLVAALLFVYFLCAGYSMYKRVIDSRDVVAEIESIRAQEGFITADKLPKIYLDGVVIVEDKNFYSHKGLDYSAIAKAAVYNISSFSLSYGGSTITQQIAKNLFFTNEKKIERKAAEVFMVRVLEENYTKIELLELYVNIIDFGEGYTGILEASRGYYGKEPIDLAREECAMLIGVPNSPKLYSPVSNPKLAEKKQRYVIEELREYGVWGDD